MSWLARLIAEVTQLLLPVLITAFVKWKQKREQKEASVEEVDQALTEFKAAIIEAQDGKPMTPEQTKRMRDAYRKLIRS